VAAEH